MSDDEKRPAAGCSGGRGAGGYLGDGHPQPTTSRPASKPPRLKVTASGPGGVFTVSGQTARALLALVNAAGRGVTALEVSTWALRLAAYVHSLRRLGIVVSMLREPHPGGWHGRYVLSSPVAVQCVGCGEGGGQ
jgi:hypothetical protein